MLKQGEIYIRTDFILPPDWFVYMQMKEFGNIFTVLLIKNTCKC